MRHSLSIDIMGIALREVIIMNRMATLSNVGDVTIFAYKDIFIRYTKVLEWDNGYIVVMARYDNSDSDEEDYIDLYPILRNLYI